MVDVLAHVGEVLDCLGCLGELVREVMYGGDILGHLHAAVLGSLFDADYFLKGAVCGLGDSYDGAVHFGHRGGNRVCLVLLLLNGCGRCLDGVPVLVGGVPQGV